MRVRTDDAAQRAIDEEIRALKSRRNQHTAIAQLSDEILTLVFLANKVEPCKPMEWYRAFSLANYLGWSNVAGVCRHWRNVALDTPQLWSTIKITHFEHSAEMLRRSKSAPLHLYLDLCEADFNASLWVLIENLIANNSRIERMYITLADAESLSRLIGSSPAPCMMPQLRRLRINTPYDFPFDLKGVLWREMPSLQTLDITDVLLPDPLPYLGRLTRLSIHMSDDPDWGSQPLSLSWLIRSLSNTPYMELIRITAEFHDDSSELPSSTLLSLSRLKFIDMRFRDDLRPSKLFNFFVLPHFSRIIVDYTCHALPVRIDFPSLRGLCSRFTACNGSIHKISVTVSTLLVQVYSSAHEDITDTPVLTLCVPEPNESRLVAPYFELFQALPLSMTHILALGSYDSPSPSKSWGLWKQLLPSFTLLKTLSFFGAFELPIYLLNDVSPDMLSVPNLEVVTFEEMVFNHPSSDYDEACRLIINIIQQRKQNGVPVRKLRIIDCYSIEESLVNDLKQIVEVDWDEAS